MANETPTFHKVISDIIQASLAELHTSMPGIIESFDEATGLAFVTPCLKREYQDGTVVTLPVIPNVPVMFPRAGGAAITFELEKGDPVWLIFGERSIDLWITNGGTVNPKDPRKHALSDAVAFPGVYPKNKPVSDAKITTKYKKDGSVVTKNEKGSYTFDKDGAFSIKNEGWDIEFSKDGKFKTTAGGVDFFTQLLLVIDNLAQETKVATSIGLQPFIPGPTYPTERAKLDEFI